MNKPDPKRGDRSDDSHRGVGSVAGIAQWDTLGKVVVRTDSSNADAIQFCATTTGTVRSQSERDLDLPEPRGSGEGRASGKSDGKRSDRRETSGGAVPSAGWREVAEWCHVEGGVGHE